MLCLHPPSNRVSQTALRPSSSTSIIHFEPPPHLFWINNSLAKGRPPISLLIYFVVFFLVLSSCYFRSQYSTFSRIAFIQAFSPSVPVFPIHPSGLRCQIDTLGSRPRNDNWQPLFHSYLRISLRGHDFVLEISNNVTHFTRLPPQAIPQRCLPQSR